MMQSKGYIVQLACLPLLFATTATGGDKPNVLLILVDGLSLVPVLRDPSARVRDHAYHAYPKQKLGRAIRTERYRMVQWASGAGTDDVEYELYDYQTDPGETKNLAERRPEVVAELKAKLAAYPPPVSKAGRAKKR